MPVKTNAHDAVVLSSDEERRALESLVRLHHATPVPDDEILANLGLFLTSKNLARLLFFCDVYQRILRHHGVILEFGVRWGQTLALLSALRGLFEPFNRHRKIVGFDTFQGFVGMGEKDGARSGCKDGSFSVTPDYDRYLSEILEAQEKLNPMAHLRRFELVKGDASHTVPAYFQSHPETVVSLAIFDFDLYAPTRAALEAIRPHVSKGSVLVFDELSDDIFPGETVALKEVWDLKELRIRRLPFAARLSYAEIE